MATNRNPRVKKQRSSSVTRRKKAHDPVEKYARDVAEGKKAAGRWSDWPVKGTFGTWKGMIWCGIGKRTEPAGKWYTTLMVVSQFPVRAFYGQVAKGGFRANLTSICSLEWTPLSFGLVYKPVDIGF